jgi:hypothetical protein
VIAASINKLMEDSEEGNALRKKVQELRTMATKALEKGGSSYNDVGRLMDELMARCTRKRPGQLMDSDLTVLLNFMCFRTFELSGIVFFFKERQKVCLNSLIEKSRKFDSQDFSVTTLPWAKKDYSPAMKRPKCLAPATAQVLASDLILSKMIVQGSYINADRFLHQLCGGVSWRNSSLL